MNGLTERYKVIDIDTHIVEPYDLWTSRISTHKYGDKVPHVRRDADGQDFWYFGEQKSLGAAWNAYAGSDQYAPVFPRTLDEAKVETYDVGKRLAKMDEYGIYAQVLFPNLVGLFAADVLRQLDDGDLMMACVRAYNDFQTEWASADANRLLPMAVLPFWDVDLAVAEMERCRKMGHRGIVLSDRPQDFGKPKLTSAYWDRLWAAAQDLAMPVNFHIGSGDNSDMMDVIDVDTAGPVASFTSLSTLMFLGNAQTLVQLICGGICHRFPKLNFVSVESGVGWVPFCLHSLDWQWKNTNMNKVYPDYKLTPTEYFRRQIYASFWFESPETLGPAIDVLGDENILYETDFPHVTSMSPGPASPALNPRDYIEQTFAAFPESAARKILHDNAARIYGIA